MVKVIGKVMDKGKRVGFLVNYNGKTSKISDDTALRLINDGRIELRHNDRGFYLTDGRYIKDLQEVELKQDKVRNESSARHQETGVTVYTGSQLKKYAQSVTDFKERDFVSEVQEYCNSNRIVAFIISGLRGVGKTTGILQVINHINDYDKTLFININANAKIDMFGIQNIVESRKNIKYVFIDEASRIERFVGDASIIGDIWVKMGLRVVISGTDSLALEMANDKSLYHRTNRLCVTHMNFSEAKRVLGINMLEYIRTGGMFENCNISNLTSLKTYMETSVVDNIVNTIDKNKDITGIAHLRGMSEQQIRNAVMRIIYSVIYNNVTKVKKLRVQQIISMFKHDYDKEALNSDILNELGIDINVSLTVPEIQEVLDAMEKMGVLIKARNLDNIAECNYYVTNPAIVYQVINLIYSSLHNRLERKPNTTIRRIDGTVYESIVMTHFYYGCLYNGAKLYYYRDNQGREIDLIVEKEVFPYDLDTPEHNSYILCEIKMTDDSDWAVSKSKWIANKDIQLDRKIATRCIIYSGENKQFSGYEHHSKDLNFDIEEQNKGVSLINCEKLIKNTKEYIQTVYTHYESIC